MTLVYYGKSRRRQGGLAAAALLAVLVALAAAVVLQGRNAEAATTTLAPTSASCDNDSQTDDDFGANSGFPCSGNAATLASDDSTWFNVETDDLIEIGGGWDVLTGDDDLSVTFSIPGNASAATNVQLKVWAAAADDAGQLKAGSNASGNDDRYGSLALGGPATYIDSDLTNAVKNAAGGNFTVNLSMNCVPNSNDCEALVNKVELVFDVVTQDEYEAQLHSGDANPQLTQTDLCGAANFQFVLDRSGSMDDNEAALEGAVNTFVNGWEGDFPGAATYGGVFFGDGSASAIAGGGYTTAGAFTAAVTANSTYDGFTPTALGITTATGNTANRLPNVPDIMFIITDGSPNQPDGGLDFSDPVRWVNAANAAIDAANTARADNAGEVTGTANRFLVYAVFVGEGDTSGPFGDMNGWAAAVMTQLGGGSYVSSSFDNLPAALREILNCEEPKGTIEIHKDDSQAGDQGTPNPVAGATFKLEGPNAAVLCVTDDSDGNTDTTTAVSCGGGATPVDDENDAGGTTVVSGLAPGSWTVTEVGVPAGYGPDACGNVRAVQVSGGNTAVINGAGCTAGSPGTTAFHNPPLPRGVTVKIYKLVCDSADDFPATKNDILALDTDAEITTFGGDSCDPASGWHFTYLNTGADLGPTDANGLVTLTLPGTSIPSPIRIAEVTQSAYIPFAGGDYPANSALISCQTDNGWKGDNEDWVNNAQAGGTYYCVAFNALKPFTITAEKVVCDSEADLPNWAGTGPVTPQRVADFVTERNGRCAYDPNWVFEVHPTANLDERPGDNIQHAPNFTNFTGSIQLPADGQHRIREQLPAGYVPFTGVNGSNVSAEFYCDDDVLNYDNLEWVGPEDAYCVGFNAPETGDIIVHKEYEAPNGYTPDLDDEPAVTIEDNPMTRTGANTWQESVEPGTTFAINETPAPGWQFVKVELGDGCMLKENGNPEIDTSALTLDDDPLVQVGVEAGVECHITYTNRMAGTVVVQKVDQSANLQNWTFAVDGPGTNDFNLAITGSGSETFQDQPFGSYSAAETNPGLLSSVTQCPSPNPNGQGTYWSLSTPNGTAIQNPGDTITFIFTNQDCPRVLASGNLRIEKWNDLDGDGNRDGGEPAIANWPVTVSGPEFPGGQAFLTNASGLVNLDGITAGFYTVTEGSQGGWQQTGLIVNGAPQPLSATAVVEVKDLEEFPDAVVQFGNRELATVMVLKTVTDQVGNRGVGGWQVNLAGCGTSINKVTDATGTAVFSNLLPAVNCAYTVTEVDSEGFSVSYPGGQVVAPGPGEEATVRVHNSRTITITSETPTPTPTSTPVTPTEEPTEEPTATPETPAPTQTVAGEKTPGPEEPGTKATPIAPETGTGFRGGGTAGSIGLALAGLLAVSGGMLLLSLGRKRS